MSEDVTPSTKVEFELEFGKVMYRVLLFGDMVTVLRNGREYAAGTWKPLGGYAVYAFDGPNSTLNWSLFDKIDLSLRKLTKFKQAEGPFYISRNMVYSEGSRRSFSFAEI